MSRCNDRASRALAALLAAAALAGCSDIYYDRRETILSGGPDAVAANQAAQMVDPWPRASADKNFSFNGERIALGMERYRTGRVLAPTSSGTSSAGYAPPQQPPAGAPPASAPAGTPVR